LFLVKDFIFIKLKISMKNEKKILKEIKNCVPVDLRVLKKLMKNKN